MKISPIVSTLTAIHGAKELTRYVVKIIMLYRVPTKFRMRIKPYVRIRIQPLGPADPAFNSNAIQTFPELF
jgi:hypothetical protein